MSVVSVRIIIRYYTFNSMNKLFMWSLCGLLTACLGTRETFTESDYSYYGRFKTYRTFSFIEDLSPNRTEEAVALDLPLRTAITKRMRLQGYEMTESDPSLLVSYRIFYDDLRFQGYRQPELERWVELGREEDKYDPVKYQLRKGTLLILFYDRKQERTIWQGYTSGVFGQPFLDSERSLNRAVRSILDRYRLFAEGYIADKDNS